MKKHNIYNIVIKTHEEDVFYRKLMNPDINTFVYKKRNIVKNNEEIDQYKLKTLGGWSEVFLD